MDETRREIFRTSILSAIGASIGAVAVAGYVAVREQVFRPRTLVSALASTVVAVYDQGGSPNLWYFFAFGGSTPLTCALWKAVPNTPFPSIVPSTSSSPGPSLTNAVDTYSWYKSLASQVPPQVSLVKSANLTIQYTANPTPSISATTDSTGNLTSLDSLLAALVDMQQFPGSWNEIGKQK